MTGTDRDADDATRRKPKTRITSVNAINERNLRTHTISVRISITGPEKVKAIEHSVHADSADAVAGAVREALLSMTNDDYEVTIRKRETPARKRAAK